MLKRLICMIVILCVCCTISFAQDEQVVKTRYARSDVRAWRYEITNPMTTITSKAEFESFVKSSSVTVFIDTGMFQDNDVTRRYVRQLRRQLIRLGRINDCRVDVAFVSFNNNDFLYNQTIMLDFAKGEPRPQAFVYEGFQYHSAVVNTVKYSDGTNVFDPVLMFEAVEQAIAKAKTNVMFVPENN